jgi:hypothetical protein
MKTIWFKRAGWIYVPVHPAGLVITLAAIIFLVPVWFAVNSNGQSISNALYEMFIYVSCTGFWWKWVAEKTSSR